MADVSPPPPAIKKKKAKSGYQQNSAVKQLLSSSGRVQADWKRILQPGPREYSTNELVSWMKETITVVPKHRFHCQKLWMIPSHGEMYRSSFITLCLGNQPGGSGMWCVMSLSYWTETFCLVDLSLQTVTNILSAQLWISFRASWLILTFTAS